MRFATLALLALTLPAAAQTRPLLLPARDVMVQYALTGTDGASTGSETWFYSASAQLFRIEAGRMDGYSLLGADNTLRAVNHTIRQVVKVERRPGGIFGVDSVFTRLGAEQVAGRDCTNWRVTAPGGATPPPEVCLTAQGVILRRRFGNTVATATAVTNLAPEQQPADRFALPPGYPVVIGQTLPR